MASEDPLGLPLAGTLRGLRGLSLSESDTADGITDTKSSASSIDLRDSYSTYTFKDTFKEFKDAAKFYEEPHQTTTTTTTTTATTTRGWKSASSSVVSTPASSSANSTFFHASASRIGRNSTHGEGAPGHVSSSWAGSDHLDGFALPSTSFTRKLNRLSLQGGRMRAMDDMIIEERHSTTAGAPLRSLSGVSGGGFHSASMSTSLNSSPILWATVPSVEDTPPTSAGSHTRTSRFFPSPLAEGRSTTSRSDQSGRSLSAAASPLNLGIYSKGFAFETPSKSRPFAAVDPIDEFSLEPSMKSAQLAVASVLEGLEDSPISPVSPVSPSPNGLKLKTGIEFKSDKSIRIKRREAEPSGRPLNIPTSPRSFRQLDTTTRTEAEEVEDNTYEVSVPQKRRHAHTSSADPHATIINYIRTVITKESPQFKVYIASLPYDTPVVQCHNLIAQAFRNYGKVFRVVKDTFSRPASVTPENDLFVRFRVVAKLFSDQKLPYKSHRFVNETSGRESKMLLFFDYDTASASDTNGKACSGFQKQEISTHPEGFASTFHKRGVNNFMFVRELQSKMIINKTRLNNSVNLETAEFRVSLPVDELGLGHTDDAGALKRSYVVSIDVHDLDSKNRPSPHAGAKKLGPSRKYRR